MRPFMFIEQTNKRGYWINELRSLGISPKKTDRLYEKESYSITELTIHVENIKIIQNCV